MWFDDALDAALTQLQKAVELNPEAAEPLRNLGALHVKKEQYADAIAFFAAFEGMETGFAERAKRVEQLLGERILQVALDRAL